MITHDGITKAALEIAYDNGGINRYRTEEDALIELNTFLVAHGHKYDLTAIDKWLVSLDEDHLAACCHEEEETMLKALEGAPSGTHDLLNEIFEEVC